MADRLADVLEQRLDLGSVVLPMPEGTQLQVEMSATGAPQAVHLTLPHGRITVAAYAAPKSPGQWREVTADLAESLRKDNAKVSVEMGPWGREVVASTPNADLRFIGVDGYRWMVRLVAAGPAGATVADGPLIKAARAVLSETVVRRGSDPHPVRTPLPVVLPAALAQQLAAAHQQQVAAAQAAAQQAQQSGQPPQPLQQQPQQPQHRSTAATAAATAATTTAAATAATAATAAIAPGATGVTAAGIAATPQSRGLGDAAARASVELNPIQLGPG